MKCFLIVITGVDVGEGLSGSSKLELLVTKGHSVCLACLDTQTDSLVSWYHDGRPLLNDSRRWVADNGSLVINKVRIFNKMNLYLLLGS